MCDRTDLWEKLLPIIREETAASVLIDIVERASKALKNAGVPGFQFYRPTLRGEGQYDEKQTAWCASLVLPALVKLPYDPQKTVVRALENALVLLSAKKLSTAQGCGVGFLRKAVATWMVEEEPASNDSKFSKLVRVAQVKLQERQYDAVGGNYYISWGRISSLVHFFHQLLHDHVRVLNRRGGFLTSKNRYVGCI